MKIRLIFVTCDFTWHVRYQRASVVKFLSKKHCIESGSVARLSPKMTDDNTLCLWSADTQITYRIQLETIVLEEVVSIVFLFFSLCVIYSYEIGFSCLCNSLFKMFLYRYTLVLIHYANLAVKYS